jgi:hypothetical protein
MRIRIPNTAGNVLVIDFVQKFYCGLITGPFEVGTVLYFLASTLTL